MAIKLSQSVVTIDGKPKFIFSGEVLPHRLPHDQWQDRLEKVKAAGLNCIGAYFAWDFHVPLRDTVDFNSPGRDIARLLELAAKVGLYVLVRPGPYICNEWDLGGYPAWLLTEDSGDWRTGDFKHMDWCRRWYQQVNQVIAPHQLGRQGSVILYQVENEHFFGDRLLLNGLAEQALADGIEVPLISNGGGSANRVRSKVIDGADIYTNVYEMWRWRGWLEMLRRLKDPEVPLMLIEYSAATITLWGDIESSETVFPSEWVLTQDHLFMGLGANLLNHFVIAGGITPVGYGSDHITTSYGQNAAITPWGELGRKFYLIRLLGELVNSINEELALSCPWGSGWGTDNPEVECLVRKGENGLFLFPVNHSVEPQEFTIILPDSRRLPEKGKITLKARESQVLLADFDLGNNLRLVFCSAQVMKVWRDGTLNRMVVYGSEHTQGYAEFDYNGVRKRIHFTCTASVNCVKVDFVQQKIELFAVSTAMAEKTWFIEEGNQNIPLFSNLSLVRPGRDVEGVVRAEISADTDLNLITYGIDRLLINGVSADMKVRSDNLSELRMVLPQPAKPVFTLGEPHSRVEDDWTDMPAREEDGWVPIELFTGKPEIIINPGTYEYQTIFEIEKELPPTLELLGVSSVETIVFLNGKQLGVFPTRRPTGYHTMDSFCVVFPIEGIVHSGTNRLSLQVTLIGRHNHGQPVYAGLSHPVVMYRVRKEQILPTWYIAPHDDRKWLARELGQSPSQTQPDCDISGWERIDLTCPRRLPIPDLTNWRQVRWYRTKIKISKDLCNRPLFLECPNWGEVWAYIDGMCIGRVYAATSTTFDISTFADREEMEITLALRHNWPDLPWGLSSSPKLVAFDQVLRGTWFRRKGTQGEREDWITKQEGWQPLTNLSSARRVWYCQTVQVERSEGLIAPIYLELDGWYTHATIYWNGETIGLYATVGQENKFYIPEGLIQENNTMVIVVDGYDQPAQCGQVRIGTYYRALPIRMRF